MDRTEPGGSPQLCGCLSRLLRKPRSIKAADGAGAVSGSSTDSALFKADALKPEALAAQPATLKPPRTGRRSRSDSPKSEGGADEQPVKRQNSMGHDGPELGPPAADVQPMEETGAAVEAPAAPSARAAAVQPQQQQQAAAPPQLPPQPQQHHHSGGSPVHASVTHACPPFGSKSVIGRRAKMEDACVAVPFLIEVNVGRGSMDELLPPRIAPQLRSPSLGSAASEQTAATAFAAGSSSSGRRTSGGGEGGPCGPPHSSGLHSLSLDAAASRSSGDGSTEMEVLHFFGVFDGHGGSDAAMHCAKSLHERVREVLSAASCSTPADLASMRSKGHSGGSSSTAAAAVAAVASQASSSGNGSQQQPAASSSSARDDARSHAPHSRMRPHAAGSGGAVRRDAAETGPLLTTRAGEEHTSSSGSFLDADFDGEERAVASNSVQGVSCTTETIEAALTKAFHITDEEFGNMGGYEHLALVGTTAVVALVGSRMMYVANCGDSRAVLCRSGGALPLTDDHKAAREDETARVEAAGGQILFWNGVRVMGLLAVSRAIGDHSLRPYVIAEPEVTILMRHADDELLVMASDGLWDVMSNQEAVTLAKKCLGRARSRGSTRQSAARVAATVLTRAAVDRGSRDNVTVVIVDLSPMTAEEVEVEAALSERSETVPDPSTQRQRQPPPPSGVAVRSSGTAGQSPAPPPVQASPFAGAAALPTSGPISAPPAVSPFAEEANTPLQPLVPAVAPAKGPAADSGTASVETGGCEAMQQRPTGAALVSPFSGSLPAGLDFDVQQHAGAVAAAASAAAAAATAPGAAADAADRPAGSRA